MEIQVQKVREKLPLIFVRASMTCSHFRTVRVETFSFCATSCGDKLEYFHQIDSDAPLVPKTAVFLVFGFVSAQFDFPSPARMMPRWVDALARMAVRVFKPAPSLTASPKTKNPRCPSLPLFCQCSNFDLCQMKMVTHGIDVDWNQF